MEQIIPDNIYWGLPCSMVAVGCALGYTKEEDIARLDSNKLKEDGYLSLKGMNTLIRSHLTVKKAVYYKKKDRITLKDFTKEYEGIKAVICLLGHFIYYDGKDYHSFFKNDDDPVVQAWFLKD